MKKILIPILSLGLLASLPEMRAQDPAGATGYAAVQQVKLSPEQLDGLVSPIALYPDPLVALILPASTVPTDVVLAARYVKSGGDVNQVDGQNWDPSVKSLTRYPDVLNMMDENLDWTNQLGAAVISQQGDVMQSIQNQRAKANALGNLTTTPQQQVVVEKQIIQIVPADPEIIYVPQYDPQVVYVQAAPSYSPFISFSIGFAMGAWLTNDCDWYNRGFYVNHWGNNGWHGYPRYNNVNVSINRNNYWQPNPYRPAPRPPYVPNRANPSRPQAMPAFRQAPQGGWNGSNNRNQNVQNNHSPAIAPASVNSPATPNLPGPASGGNGGQNRRNDGSTSGLATAPNRNSQNRPGQVPEANQNPAAGSAGNNNPWNREGGRKDRPQTNPSTGMQQPTPNLPVIQPETIAQPRPVASRPQAAPTPAQPGSRPPTQWKNPRPSTIVPQVQQPGPVQKSAGNSEVAPSRPSRPAGQNQQNQQWQQRQATQPPITNPQPQQRARQSQPQGQQRTDLQQQPQGQQRNAPPQTSPRPKQNASQGPRDQQGEGDPRTR